MSEVNVLWSSAWRRLQRRLAGGVGAEGAGASPMRNATPVQGIAVPPSSWLVRAHSRKEQRSRIIL
jgi:hypothetical protein